MPPPPDPRSNNEVCDEFRALLTEKFYVVTPFGDVMSPKLTESRLNETKPWRSELWKAFREIEDRLCPQRAREREEWAKRNAQKELGL